MNPFDASLVTWLNGFAHRWSMLDRAVVLLATGIVAKGTFVALFVWWPWHDVAERMRRNREVITATVLACFVTLAVGLAIQKLVPFRVRPIQNPDLHFVIPYGQEPLTDWPSSFPSDHAMLFATLAMATWFIQRRFGAAAHLFAFLLIGMPRVYLGLHHPTDILAGAALGIAVGALANSEPIRPVLARWPMRGFDRHPGLVSAILFLLLLQIAHVFWEARVIAGVLASLVRGG